MCHCRVPLPTNLKSTSLVIEIMPRKRVAVGIDLGTTNSLVSCEQNGNMHIVSADGNSRLLPSVVYMQRPRIFGSHALKKETSSPQLVVHSVKRLIGRGSGDPTVWALERSVGFTVEKSGSEDVVIEVEWPDPQKLFKPEQMSAMILGELKRQVEKLLGKTAEDAVITVPAAFKHAQRMATKTAGIIAGFENITVIDEPTAAALAWVNENRDVAFDGNGKVILVFDMGGGTTDVSIVSIEQKTLEVISTHGDPQLGGNDVDQILADHFIEEIRSSHGKDISTNPKAMATLRRACRDLKHQLTKDNKVNSIEETLISATPIELTMTKSKFEELIKKIKERVLELIKMAVSTGDCSGKPVDINNIVLIGGASKMRWVKEMFKEPPFSSIPIWENINTDEAVALGAGLYACKLYGTEDVCPDVQIKDVSPLTYGIDVNGSMSEFVKRNASIPLSVTKEYSTTSDQQDHANIQIFEGEMETRISEFSLPLKSDSHGNSKYEVTFSYSHDFNLKVMAKDLSAGGDSREIQIDSSDIQNTEKVDEARRIEERLVQADQDEDERQEVLEELQELKGMTNINTVRRYLEDNEYATLQELRQLLESLKVQMP